MKKLVAISVLFAGLAMAVSAQWNNEWKVGMTARFITEMFYTTKATGSDKTERNDTPAVATNGTVETESGQFAKGTTYFFPNRRSLPQDIGGDNRLFLSLRNTGENYDMSFNISMDNWANNYGGYGGASILKLLIDANQREDWGIKGTAGIFYAGIGPWASDVSWVDANAMWGTWSNRGSRNRFGLWTYSTSGAGNYHHFNHMRSLNGEWGDTPLVLGINLGDNYRFNLGYIHDGWSTDAASPTASKSAINGSFILSGSPADMISFDLYYGIRGQDPDTFNRPGTYFGYNDPSGKWLNQIGAYVQVKGIENLNLSVGYSARFNAYETGGFLRDSGKLEKVEYIAPVTSGIDLRVGFSGIDKINLRWNNNISFASAKGDKIDGVYKDKINLLFDENFTNARDEGIGVTQNWFHWGTRLRSDLGFIDGVGLEATVGNDYGVFEDKVNKSITPAVTGATTTETKNSKKSESNEFYAVVGANYAIGNVSLGLALFFQWNNTTVTTDNYTKTTPATGTGTETKLTQKTVNNTVQFGIPVRVQVSF